MNFLILILISTSAFANGIEVIKPEGRKYVDLKIIRVEVDSFDTYLLTNENLIEMSLVCKGNVVYDYNKTAILRYKNFYNLPVYDFKIPHNKICKDMGMFIEAAHMAVDEERPFKIRLNVKTGYVAQIEYPAIDEYSPDGEIEDLLPKRKLILVSDGRDKKKPSSPKNH